MGRKRDPKVTKLREEAQTLYNHGGLTIAQVAKKLGIKFHIARDYVFLKERQKSREPRQVGTCKCGSPAYTKFKGDPTCRDCMIDDGEDLPTLEDYVSGRYELGTKTWP